MWCHLIGGVLTGGTLLYRFAGINGEPEFWVEHCGLFTFNSEHDDIYCNWAEYVRRVWHDPDKNQEMASRWAEAHQTVPYLLNFTAGEGIWRGVWAWIV